MSATMTIITGQEPELRSPYTPPKALKNNIGDALDESNFGWLKETPATTSIEEMRSNFLRDGYIFIKNLLPRKEVLEVREDYFARLKPTGILKPGTLPVEGIWNPSIPPGDSAGVGSGKKMSSADVATQLLIEAHKAPKYLALLSNPTLRDMVRRFTGWEKEILLKRNLIRHSQPGATATSIHYDKLFLRAGEAEFLTVWVPLGDIAPSGGSLMYLENSTPLGRSTEAKWTSRNLDLAPEERINAYNVNMGTGRGLGIDAAAFQRENAPDKRWLISRFEAGDVVFHNPYMVHCASMNMAEDGKIRLSADVRFYQEGSDYDLRWMTQFWHPEDKL